jgi:hypothetical protein
MESFRVRQEDTAEAQVLTGLTQAEIAELREWLCYTKPIGPSIKFEAPATNRGDRSCIVTAGNAPGLVEEICVQKLTSAPVSAARRHITAL